MPLTSKGRQTIKLFNEGKKPMDVVRAGILKKSQAYTIYDEWKAGVYKEEEASPSEAKEVKPKVEEIEKKPTIPTLKLEEEGKEEREAEEAEELEEEIIKRVEEGFFTQEDIESIIESINSWIKKHPFDEREKRLLSKVWVRPINRKLEEYELEDLDIYLAIVATFIITSSKLKEYAEDKRKEKE